MKTNLNVQTRQKDATIGPEAYYARNAELHSGEADQADLSPVVATGRLPARPSQIDWAIYWLVNRSGPIQHQSCLDVGCAQLEFLCSAADLFENRYGVDITLFDNWPHHPDIKTQVCNLNEQHLLFDDQMFDAVVMLAVLEHVFNPFHAVRELRRVCKPDGHVVIGVPNIAGIKQRLALLLGRLPVTSADFSFYEDAWDGYHLHNFTKASLAWLLQREGLKPLEWASEGRLQLLKRWRPSLFGGGLMVLCSPSTPQPQLRLSF